MTVSNSAIRCVLVIAAAIAVLGIFGLPSICRAAEPLRVHMLSGSKEYDSGSSLEKFKRQFEANYQVACTISRGSDGCTEFPGLAALDEADVLVVFCRRTKPNEKQLNKIRAWCAAGKPVVGIRTASHAFQNWLDFDKVVLGGDYQGHYRKAADVRVTLTNGAAGHPILEGFEPWTRTGKLYKNPELAGDVTLLLSGQTDRAAEPLAWCRTYGAKGRGRAFYTAMGVPADFDDAAFLRLLTNAVAWTAGCELPKQ